MFGLSFETGWVKHIKGDWRVLLGWRVVFRVFAGCVKCCKAFGVN